MMLAILVSTAVRLVLLGAATWLALRLVRVCNPHVEALAWRLLLVAGLAMPLLMLSGLAPTVTTTLELPLVLTVGGSMSASAWPENAAEAGDISFADVFLSIYLLVALLLLGRLAAGLIGLWRVAARAPASTERDDVRITSRVRSPATFGSVILLPHDWEHWPAEKRQAVLAHERAHVRSHDGYWSWLAQLHAAVFWFNPMAWWLRRRLEILAETTSDDAVVAARHDPIAYAALLLDFARQPNSRSVAMSVAESNVPGRIERLIARTPPGTELSRFARWSAFAAVIPAMFLAASTTGALAQGPTPLAAEPSAPADSGTAVQIVRAPDPDRFYPEAAKQAMVTALVLIEVDVDAQGKVVEAKVLEPLPANDPYGFGAAAIAVAREAQYSNPLGKVSSLKFKVKFALTADPPVAPKT
jgi:TonB family protein